jgi:hypothetical protein
MREFRRARGIQAVAAAAFLAGCGSRATSECQAVLGLSASDRRVVLGRLVDNAFHALAAGDSVDVVHGFQGGTWIMPGLSFGGCAPNGHMVASLTLVDGPVIGRNSLPLRLDRQPDGSLQLEYLPVPAGLEPGSPPLEAIDGKQAVLSTRFTDDCGVSIEGTDVIKLKVIGP